MHESLPRHDLELALSRLTDRTLSRGERNGHVLLSLLAAGMAAIVASLLITETDLPLRTGVAFAVMLAIALAWVGYALRVLSRRLPVLANREVVAGRMSLWFSALFTGGALLVGMIPAAWLGALMMAAALSLLIRAHRRLAALRQLREHLERELSQARAAS